MACARQKRRPTQPHKRKTGPWQAPLVFSKENIIGQNVDQLVVDFGPPANTFKMNSGDTSYIWQLGNQTNINTDRGTGTANTRFCKVSVIASKTGIVSQLNTEDSNAGGGLEGALGMYGSICANRLGIQRRQQT